MIQSAAQSDIGRKRQTNQDYFLANSGCQLYVVADGLGGHAAGAVAARLSVTAIADFIQLAGASADVSWPFGYNLQFPFEHNVLRTAILIANMKVCHLAEEREDCSGMGSTVVLVWVRGQTAFWTHVGDSRLYLFRNGQLQQLSEDHSLVQEQLRRGIISPAEALTHSLRHVVTRAIGSRDPLDIEIHELSLHEGDHLLLCCDGLSDKVSNQQIHQQMSTGRDLQTCCQSLIDAANEAGGEDNITAVLLRYTD
jgi:PPM family protein phosphatase